MPPKFKIKRNHVYLIFPKSYWDRSSAYYHALCNRPAGIKLVSGNPWRYVEHPRYHVYKARIAGTLAGPVYNRACSMPHSTCTGRSDTTCAISDDEIENWV